jgi:PKD domain
MRSEWKGRARSVSAIAVGAAFLDFASPAFPATYNLHGAPVASFVWSPRFPHIGDPITLTSTSRDLGSRIVGYAWDFADNGPFGAFQEGGPVAGASFATPAPHVVRLRVTAADGLSSIAAETITMTPPPASARIMYPFPTVRIRGRDLRSGVKITQLAVRAPTGARINVTCRSRRCPARSASRMAVSTPGRATWVTFRRFQRFLPAGLTLQVRVSRNREIGSYTRFQVRRRKLPIRTDSCLDSSGVEPIACPSA